MRKHEIHHYGVALTSIASTLWAFGYFFRKEVLKETSPVVVAFLTSTIVAIAIQCYFGFSFSRSWIDFKKAPLRICAVAVSGVCLGTILMFYALARIDLGVSTLLEKLQPVFTVFLALTILGEIVPLKKIPFMCLALLAAYIVAAPNPFDSLSFDAIGVSCAVGAALSWALAAVIAKTILNCGVDPLHLTYLRFLLASLILGPYCLITGNILELSAVSLYAWSLIIGAALLSTCLGYVLYYRGLKLIAANEAAWIELLTPGVAVVLGILFFHERFSVTQILGVPLLLWSIVKITIQPKSTDRPDDAPMETM